jgi:nucleoside-diphosphate-sugar epimerase
MKYLISGASGYIGTKLVNSLIKDQQKPGIIVRSELSSSGYIDKNEVNVYLADITKPINLSLNEDYDVFIHLAAANDIDSSDSFIALNGTTLGTRNCLEFCKKNNIKRFIYFSTFQALGKVDGYLDENTIPEPKNDYGITHFFAEEYVKMYQLTSGINYTIIRPTNIYGSPSGINIDRWSLVPNCFCKEAYENHCITLLSSGKQKRDFLHLDDLVNVTKLIAQNNQLYNNQVLNLSSGNNYTIIEIAQMVATLYEQISNKPCQVIIKSEQPLKSNEYTIDRSLISKLGYDFSPWNSIIEEINITFEKLINKL